MELRASTPRERGRGRGHTAGEVADRDRAPVVAALVPAGIEVSLDEAAAQFDTPSVLSRELRGVLSWLPTSTSPLSTRDARGESGASAAATACARPPGARRAVPQAPTNSHRARQGATSPTGPPVMEAPSGAPSQEKVPPAQQAPVAPPGEAWQQWKAAIDGGRWEALCALLESGADLEAQSSPGLSGITPLTYCIDGAVAYPELPDQMEAQEAYHWHVAAAELLLERGAKVSPMHLRHAVKDDIPELVAAFASHEAVDVNACVEIPRLNICVGGTTALNLAARMDHLECLAVLLRKGAILREVDIAAASGQCKCALSLLSDVPLLESM